MGGNNQYKCFFRHIYYTYEVALSDNLRIEALRSLLRRASIYRPPRLKSETCCDPAHNE